ncbi:MAG TPA: protein kinase [Gaiellaceae bacterium]|nr:protein kinase [Gaiellaceae bacterium]
MVGQVFADRYELQELVGSGAMSSVYRAHDRLLDRTVALKVLHDHHQHDPEYVERFRREARSAAVLSHPNIVTVIDRGEHEERQFIVFEYVGGQTLKQLIVTERPLPVESALALTVQVARGLSFAHKNGLVHRDVKPQNVLLNGDGQAKMTDFGIARSLDVQRGMTETGTVLGTSDYIAPEQAQGGRVDEQSDVYSLGVVLYELLTGDVPYPGENFVAVAMQHINEPVPSVREKRPDVPPRVDAAVQRAMAKSPAERFPTMADFGRELEACASNGSEEGTQVIAPPPAARRHRRVSPWPLVLVLLGVLAVCGALAYFLLHGTSSLPGGGGGSSAGPPPKLRAVTAYDPNGTGRPGENNNLAPAATDNNPATAWSTENYYDGTLNKPGVGLVLDAGSSRTVRQIDVDTTTPGFTAVIKAGDSEQDFPATVSASQAVSGTHATFTVSGGAHRYYLLWITDLGGLHRVRITEVRAA